MVLIWLLSCQDVGYTLTSDRATAVPELVFFLKTVAYELAPLYHPGRRLYFVDIVSHAVGNLSALSPAP
jgi:hypothetical protein